MAESSTITREPNDAPPHQGEKALWYMHVAGPDDVHAAPDFWTALAWAAELNTAIAQKAAKENWAADGNYPHTQAIVRRWTWSAAEHATMLARELAERQEHAEKRAAADPAEERAARWNLDGRFVYRNKHGAVGYVDGPDSNPGLIAVIKVGGADAEHVAARLHAELSKPAVDTDAVQADLRELLTILGMGDHARAASPHEVFQEALAVLRGRLTKGGESVGARYQYREIGEGEDWRDCSKEVYDNFASHPTMDTREVPASDSVNSTDPLSVEIAVRIDGSTGCRLSFGPGVKFNEGKVLVGTALNALHDELVKSCTCPANPIKAAASAAERARQDADTPERIAQLLDDAAGKAPPSRASTYRRLAAVLRQPGFGEARHG